MKINKILPYIIFKVNDRIEFVKIQKMLFKQDYCWLSYVEKNQDIITLIDLIGINFPFYISNLPYLESDRCYNINNDRNFMNKFNNDCLFIHNDISGFDFKLLRKDKLLQLEKYN